jgi:hypothetical protein
MTNCKNKNIAIKMLTVSHLRSNKLPTMFKQLLPFVKQADELEKIDPTMSYFCTLLFFGRKFHEKKKKIE